jgi:nucleoside-diphosphate-sugar epimerase
MDEDQHGMKVLVTGASGLVGSGISRWFLAQGAQVTGVVNTASGLPYQTGYNQVARDITLNGFEGIGEDFDLLVHCAALIPSPVHSYSDEMLFERNQSIDKGVFGFQKKSGVKLIYFSTAFLYAASDSGMLRETAPLTKDLAGYYQAKKEGEAYLCSQVPGSTIFRISSPFGDFAKQRNVMRIFADRIRQGLPVALIGKGERRQNFIHVDDIARACDLIFQRNASGIFNLAHKQSYRMLELAQTIKAICGSSSELIFDTSKQDVQPDVNFDISKIKRELGWEPELDLEAGLRKTFAV